MIKIEHYYKNEVPIEISSMLSLISPSPRLEEIWALMDLAWAATKADLADSQSLDTFYSHPVWTLNGIFTETHEESIYNRKVFADHIAATQPTRIADYGGGFGALARLLAKRLPSASIDVVEPYPSELALSLCKNFSNIRFVNRLSGAYDVIVALDVLEHVPAPLDLVYDLSRYTHKNSYLLLANCFYPVIKCHLPCTFYLRDTFDFLMKKMGFIPFEKVLYARTYRIGGVIRNPRKIQGWTALAKLFFSSKNSLREVYHCIRDICKK
ncbi:bifunctional 2-polyprenyl-6-hydroxyphenol methylase/3-demethylubiquinol 3-O-methyltransferase UbiG [Desulfovibrio piger]|uniref:class I SAM-dependent methyltransferase n=1 Tax=Desulfovibrio piger TaxID=901 RepID=UPI00266FDC2E|nr:class I SAM-dependent methyltransferase [Desulfovibrio piger]